MFKYSASIFIHLGLGMNFQLLFFHSFVHSPLMQSVRSSYATVGWTGFANTVCLVIELQHICSRVDNADKCLSFDKFERLRNQLNFLALLTNSMPISRFRSMLSRLVNHSRKKFIASLQT